MTCKIKHGKINVTIADCMPEGKADVIADAT